MDFRKFSGERIDNVAQYVKDYLAEHPDTILMIGTDSQQRDRYTKYSVVIVLYRKGRGGHVIAWTSRVPRIRELFAKLWKEVEMTAQTVSYLIENGIPQDDMLVHLDVNPDPEHKSYVAYNPSVGFMKGLGFRPNQIMVKPLGYVASHVADDFVRQ